MPAGLPEDVGQHLAGPVDDSGLLVEVRGRGHEAGDGEHAGDAIE